MPRFAHCCPEEAFLRQLRGRAVARDSLASRSTTSRPSRAPTGDLMIHIRRKALIPLATALAAGAVAIGSGATFTSSSNGAASFTTGTLTQTNDHAVVFNAANMKPGDSTTGTVAITN